MNKPVYLGVYAFGIGSMIVNDAFYADIEEITLVETVEQEADSLTIILKDPDFKYVDGAFFREDTPVNFRGGWDDNTVLEFEGFISVIDVDFPEDGIPTLTITCMDNSRKMNYQKKKRTWENVKLSDVIRILAAEHGLVPDVEEIGEIKPIISQGDVTDIRFILDAVKAESEEYYVRVTLNKLTVKKEKIDEPSTTELWYRQYPYDIFSFSPRVNKENKPKTTEKSDINNVSGKTETGTANNDTQRPVSGTVTPTKGSGGMTRIGGEWESVK